MKRIRIRVSKNLIIIHMCSKTEGFSHTICMLLLPCHSYFMVKPPCERCITPFSEEAINVKLKITTTVYTCMGLPALIFQVEEGRRSKQKNNNNNKDTKGGKVIVGKVVVIISHILLLLLIK